MDIDDEFDTDEVERTLMLPRTPTCPLAVAPRRLRLPLILGLVMLTNFSALVVPVNRIA